MGIYGLFLILGNAGFIPSAVVRVLMGSRHSTTCRVSDTEVISTVVDAYSDHLYSFSYYC